ncbi:hypothetical protein MIN45_P1087 [Methylomarinovum tepidoasis]|uniref:Uncharacterized protein n=1 Tax=Methylomarinovum tepidoasis TaxID=2840183 RepID=A0AAU9CER5_9GAMM|nr:hypothetical protein [Methylomarinovum sp. IN45]BCX88718.1 hypothetical protein MIN45_P1087 [Methylomarinovum sp. IN45]
MWLKWFPWRFVVRRLARAQGFIDPVALLARLRGFAQPSEVGEPIELLRAGMVFHARGLINSRVIQHNLDWVWPYWIVRQFDPHDESFIPRAFSITHVNLTHRNWTAVGWPDLDQYPIVDPRGLLTPLYDGWSLDCWIVTDDGERLLPSHCREAEQHLALEPQPAVTTTTTRGGLALTTCAWVELEDGRPVCRLEVQGHSERPAWLVISARPCNPEGISFIHDIRLDKRRWRIDETEVHFETHPESHLVNDYHAGDVALHLPDARERTQVCCEVGMATAAARYRLEGERRIGLRIPLRPETPRALKAGAWHEERAHRCRLEVPDARIGFLYDAALTTVILHCPGDAFPGPYTYRRFWFRDAAFIVHGLLSAGLFERAEAILDRFPERQDLRGYFHSQEGEWDANGEALWIMERFCRLSGRPLKPRWREAVVKGARWIAAKRLPDDGSPHGGLLPAGFSAEHLGPNDYYYWDDFWSIAGLEAAARLLDAGDPALAQTFRREAADLRAAVERSLARAARHLGRPAMPAAPTRRLDAGAIGSLAAGYPLQLFPADDPRLLDTAAFLLERCFVQGGFFQDMIHSGINAYLTLHVAQVLLRAGDPRAFELMRAVADLASPTGQWPEAIHPRTLGGCMGDGQHVWAAAEWLLMLRNAFVREESEGLILAGGIPAAWRRPGDRLRFGPAPTAFGSISLTLETDAQGGTEIAWEADWRHRSPPLTIHLPGCDPVAVDARSGRIRL